MYIKGTLYPPKGCVQKNITRALKKTPWFKEFEGYTEVGGLVLPAHFVRTTSCDYGMI